MNRYREHLIRLAFHGGIALVLLLIGGGIASRSGSPIAALVSIPFFIAAALAVGPPLARLGAEMFGNLFYPTETFDKPQPVYSIPDGLRLQDRHEEALVALQQIVDEHPQELRAYVEMTEILFMKLDDTSRAEALLQAGREGLAGRKLVQKFEKAFAVIQSRSQEESGPEIESIDVVED